MSTLEVLSCDNHVLACSKPAGLPTVPDASGDESLFDRARDWVKLEFTKPGAVFLGVVHRLDRPVSGVVVFARTSKAASRLSASFRAGETEKLYWAVADGEPAAEEGIVEQWLVKDESRNRVHVVGAGEEGAKPARTRWRILERRGTRLLLELEPLTGRAHQLRVAMSSLGLPLLGDLKYGASRALADGSVALHARSLSLPHPTRSERIHLACPPPVIPPWTGFHPSRER